MYVHDIESKITSTKDEPEIVKQTAATAYVNGKNVLGPVVGNFCMQTAIKKAREAGVGWVVANGEIFCLYSLTTLSCDLITLDSCGIEL